VDNYSDKRQTYFPVYSAGYLNGSYDEQIIGENQLNLDLIGRAKHDFGNFSSSLILGFNLNDRKLSILEGNMTSFLIPDGPLNFSNAQSINKNPSNSITNIRSSRGYSLLGLTAFNSIFLNLSYAAEAASTFGQISNSVFSYPSGDIAWQFSTLPLFKDSHVLSFGKLRLAYGVVGVQPQPYQTETLYLAGNSLFGNGAYLQSSNIGNESLKPERKTEYEIGFDLRFLDNKLSTGITYYQNYVEDMLLNVPIAPSTGFGTIYKNVGKMQNKGLELDFNYDIIKRKDLSVSMFANFSQNRNLVTDLAGASSVQVGGIGGFMANYAVQGQPVGIFMGGRYARDNQGKILFDANGFPEVNASIGKIGNPNPDWTGGFGAEAQYKDFILSMSFETSQGGDFYDGTRSVMYNFGTSVDVGNEVTTDKDLKNFQGKLIPAGTTVRGNVVDFGAGPVLCDESWYTSQGGGMGSLKEQFVVNGSWTRLRDVSLSYVLRTESFRKLTKLQSIQFKFTGRNLILWTGLKDVDPDLNQTQATLGRGIDYFENPGTRSYLFSILFNY
jgi:outer membrane receptor protein involved in Fe transport